MDLQFIIRAFSKKHAAGARSSLFIISFDDPVYVAVETII